MALKTTVQCAIHNLVGFAAVDHNTTISGETRATHVALYDSESQFIKVDEYNLCQFGSLSPNTSYILKTVYMDSEGEEVAGIIEDTTVTFSTKATTYYTPSADVDGDTITVDELDDSYWMPSVSLITGFGVGVELVDSSNNIVKSSDTTPCILSDVSEGEYTLRAFYWTGTSASHTRKAALANTGVTVEIEGPSITISTSPKTDHVDVSITLANFSSPTLFVIKLNGEEVYSQLTNITNRTYPVIIDDLTSDTQYTLTVEVTDGSVVSEEATFVTPALEERGEPNRWKDFWIAVGQPGAYSDNMVYEEVFGMFERFGIRIKHAPYSPMAKIKNMVVQSWKDEDGDDVWLPKTESGLQAITHEAVEYDPVFIIYGDAEKVNSNATIRQLLSVIEGRWLKVWDEYTQMGFEGVYLQDIDDDPKFKRRNYDFVEFTLKFKVNGTNIDHPFEGVGA